MASGTSSESAGADGMPRLSSALPPFLLTRAALRVRLPPPLPPPPPPARRTGAVPGAASGDARRPPGRRARPRDAQPPARDAAAAAVAGGEMPARGVTQHGRPRPGGAPAPIAAGAAKAADGRPAGGRRRRRPLVADASEWRRRWPTRSQRQGRTTAFLVMNCTLDAAGDAWRIKWSGWTTKSPITALSPLFHGERAWQQRAAETEARTGWMVGRIRQNKQYSPWQALLPRDILAQSEQTPNRTPPWGTQHAPAAIAPAVNPQPCLLEDSHGPSRQPVGPSSSSSSSSRHHPPPAANQDAPAPPARGALPARRPSPQTRQRAPERPGPPPSWPPTGGRATAWSPPRHTRRPTGWRRRGPPRRAARPHPHPRRQCPTRRCRDRRGRPTRRRSGHSSPCRPRRRVGRGPRPPPPPATPPTPPPPPVVMLTPNQRPPIHTPAIGRRVPADAGATPPAASSAAAIAAAAAAAADRVAAPWSAPAPSSAAASTSTAGSRRQPPPTPPPAAVAAAAAARSTATTRPATTAGGDRRHAKQARRASTPAEHGGSAKPAAAVRRRSAASASAAAAAAEAAAGAPPPPRDAPPRPPPPPLAGTGGKGKPPHRPPPAAVAPPPWTAGWRRRAVRHEVKTKTRKSKKRTMTRMTSKERRYSRRGMRCGGGDQRGRRQRWFGGAFHGEGCSRLASPSESCLICHRTVRDQQTELRRPGTFHSSSCGWLAARTKLRRSASLRGAGGPLGVAGRDASGNPRRSSSLPSKPSSTRCSWLNNLIPAAALPVSTAHAEAARRSRAYLCVVNATPML
ncbi:hypothetical protein BU14_0205s0016 [Porphyra umbilicalis]|uniref:Uncharacterized protein n=1 Tax=Porphyra umbilicalis TaxID=2786 RepID=A0A1X6P5H5_PORUM|nr:hypothetical protein BU14_0205s0016 [Porphyra umbilicalis]|eukprot:OSX76141.1 hypothetical protein BU14_0205s0016 [Porphyra umbilicalis]